MSSSPRVGSATPVAQSENAPAAEHSTVRTGLQRGNTGRDVETLQKALKRARYWLQEDGKFGARTESSLRSYQNDRGLEVTERRDPNNRQIPGSSVTNEKTVESLNRAEVHVAIDPFLSRGIPNREETKRLQENLAKLGFDAGRADGLFGGKTDAAVRAFQRRNNISETGIVDRKTQEAINGAVARLNAPTSSEAAVNAQRGIAPRIPVVPSTEGAAAPTRPSPPSSAEVQELWERSLETLQNEAPEKVNQRFTPASQEQFEEFVKKLNGVSDPIIRMNIIYELKQKFDEGNLHKFNQALQTVALTRQTTQ